MSSVTGLLKQTQNNSYCETPTNYDVVRTNLQLNESPNASPVRNSATKVHGFGPRASHTGPVRIPVISGGKDESTEQSTPRKPAGER